MLSVYVGVHRSGIGGEEPDIGRESSSALQSFELGEELGTVLNVRRHERSQLLEPIVQPAAEIVSESANAAHNRSGFPRFFVYFDSHAEFCNPSLGLIEGSFQKGVLRRLEVMLPFANKRNDFLAQYFFSADCFDVAELLVNLRVPKVLNNPSSSVYWDRDYGCALIFVSFDGHNMIVALKLINRTPLPWGEVSKTAFLLKRETATPVFVLEFGNAFFDASVGERGYPFRFEVEAWYVADAWLLLGRVKVKEGHAT